MDPTEKEKVLKALCALGVDAESLASFDDEHLAKLSAAKYSTLGILRSARPEKLEMLLAPAHGLVDCILKAQGAAAGPGPGSAALAGAVHQKLDNVLAHQQVLSQQQQAILMSVSSTLASFHLPPSSLGSAARQRLRKEVLSAYAALDANDWTWCVATGRFWPPLADTNTKVHHVRACHIFQRKWGIVDWAGLELGPSPDTPVNVIPMHGGVEHAFDGHQVIVLPSQDEEDGDTIFTVHVLDPELLKETVYGEFKSRQKKNSDAWVEPPPELAAITFMDIDKKPLKFRTASDMRPAKRCFMAHALWSLAFAKARQWQVDSGISVTINSFGWKSPNFMQARVRTALWVHMQGKVAGVDDGLLTGSVEELPTGPIDELTTGSIDGLPTGSIDGLPTGAVGSG